MVATVAQPLMAPVCNVSQPMDSSATNAPNAPEKHGALVILTALLAHLAQVALAVPLA